MMKRILISMLVLAVSAGMAYAEERLELSGQMRVQGFMIDNYGTLNSDDDTDKQSWFQQRFRLGAKLNVMEGVTANLRFDFAEDVWGSNNWSGGLMGARYGSGSELQVDRAYLAVDQEKYMFQAGQLYQGLGNSIAVDQNTTGLTFQLKLPVTIDLMYAKFDEGYADATNDLQLTDESSINYDTNGDGIPDEDTEDGDFYAINVGMSQDKMSANAFVAMASDKTSAGDDDEKMVIGLQGQADLDGITLNAELNHFMGEQSSTVDYVGTQLYVDASTNVGAAKVGGMFLYSMGTDKADEVQISQLSDFGSFAPLSYGILDFTDWGAIEDGLGRQSFEAMGANAGVIAFSGYGEMMVVEKLTLRGQLAYGMPSEDKVAELDSAILINAGLEYELLKDLSLFLSAQYMIVDSNPDVLVAEDDSPFGLATMVRLNF